MLYFDPAPRRGPLNKTEQLWYAGFVAVLIGLFLGELCSNYQPAKLGVLFILLFWVPLLAVHEAGHALAAYALGWYVGQVTIGLGPLLRTYRMGSAHVEIRAVPLEGFVRCVPRNLDGVRWKNALIYFAGPGSELLLAGAVVWIVGSERLFTLSDWYATIAWQSLAAAAASQAVLNLIPHGIFDREGRQTPNDGLGIVVSFLRPKHEYAAMIGQRYNAKGGDWEAYDPADWWKRRE